MIGVIGAGAAVLSVASLSVAVHADVQANRAHHRLDDMERSITGLTGPSSNGATGSTGPTGAQGWTGPVVQHLILAQLARPEP